MDHFVGIWQQVGALVNKVELEGRPGAWNEFGPTCTLFQARVRVDVQGIPCSHFDLFGALRDSLMILGVSSALSPNAGQRDGARGEIQCLE